eukprot:c39099_g1_i1 orf=231-1163(+)
MNDLLSHPLAMGRGTNYVDLKRETMRDLELGDVKDTNTQKNLAAFFEEVVVVSNEMEKVKQLLSRLQGANEESKSIHKAQAMKALRVRMDQDAEEVLKKAKSIKTKLEDLDRANAANRMYPGCENGTSTDRTRTSITNSLRKKLKDMMGDFQVLRQTVMDEYKETIERRYYTITGQKPDEDTVERIIETGESENFLQTTIQEQGRGKIIETIQEIQERHDAVLEIQRNLLELHQIFLDMALLVEAQGEQLNDIQHHVYHAASYIEGGTQQLRSAKNYQSSTRRWLCIAIFILLILTLIIVVPIATSLNSS